MSRRAWLWLLPVLGVGAAIWFSRKPDPPRVPSPATTAPPPVEIAPPPAAGPNVAAPTAHTSEATRLMDQLAGLLAPGQTFTPELQERLTGLQKELAAQGEPAVPALIARLDAGRDPLPVRELLFQTLRRMPGMAAERRIMSEARAGKDDTLRTMAIEELGRRRSDESLGALTDVARTDPQLPVRPLISPDRDPGSTSPELPDEETFTPRMQAIAALAARGDDRAAEVLAEIVRSGPDESIRMEAARQLEPFASLPRPNQALQLAAATDPSPHVRLAALQSLRPVASAADASLKGVLARISRADRDAGVRQLAAELLALSRP